MTTKAHPCRRCGGPKDRGVRGAQYCKACHEDMQPIWQQRERERSAIKGRAERRAAGVPQRAKKIRGDGHVWCARCADYLPPGRFSIYKTGNKAGQPSSYCRRCSKAYAHERRLVNTFGISTDQYHELLEVQDGCCAICRAKPIKNNLAVDHNHQTGKIRGLLCKRCNHDLLGSARDSIEILERAICYLESPPADTGLPVVIHEDFERDAGIIRRFGDKWAVLFEVEPFAELLRQAGVSEGDVTIVNHEPMPPWLTDLIHGALRP